MHSSAALHGCLVTGLNAADLPACIQLVPTASRDAVGYLLADMADYLDVIVPRGGKTLVKRVQQEARVPVIGHLEGNCHVYIDKDADLAMARAIALNAKMRRTGICGAAETLLVDAGCAATHLAPIIGDLLRAGCEVRGDERVQGVDARVQAASEQDWYTEYLDAIIAARVVDGVDAAIAHIARYGSAHTGPSSRRTRRPPRALPRARGQCHRAAQRLHAVCRRGRVRHGRRDWHIDGPLPCARPGRGRAAHQLQIPGEG
jgi:glutamate-5-semialdehyde dehydrogenase